MNYDQQLLKIREIESTLFDQFASLKNLQAILKWIPAAGLSLNQFDSIQQDEYNYDVMFSWHDHRWITFGVT